MKTSIMTPMAVAGIATLGIAMAPMAAADSYPTTASFGAAQELIDASGVVVTGWTVEELEPSDDVLPGYQPVGTLYEADATVTAVRGTVTPIISNFNARAANGETYRAIFTVPTPEGVNPATLTEGASSEGELFFDVTGPVPNSVIYNAGGQDLLVWTGATAAPEEVVDEVIIEETETETETEVIVEEEITEEQ
ncbi:MPT63 family protein [Mycolicibacterium sp. XJ879]